MTSEEACLEVDIRDAINWWENELTGEQRSKLLTKSWSEIGDVEQRHEFLLSVYTQRSKA
jgi:hypothetical protein